MIKKCEKIYVLGYIGRIVKPNRTYYVDFTNKNQEHFEVVNLLRHRLNRIYHRRDDIFSKNDILSYLTHKLNLTYHWGNFPEFGTLEELQKFINYLNKFSLIFIK